MYMKNIGQKLKDARNKAGLTQKEVEEKLGLRELAIKDYETERLKLPAEMAAKLAQIYKINVSELLGQKNLDKNSKQNQKLALIQSFFNDQKMNTIFLDPIIRAFLENYHDKVIELTTFELMTIDLTEKQKKDFATDLLKILATLMGADGKIGPEELAFLNTLIVTFELDEKSRAITRSITQKYLVDPEAAYFKNRHHLKHFVVWLMYFLAQSDEKIQSEEIQYIEETADILRINRSNYLYIKKFFLKDGF